MHIPDQIAWLIDRHRLIKDEKSLDPLSDFALREANGVCASQRIDRQVPILRSRSFDGRLHFGIAANPKKSQEPLAFARSHEDIYLIVVDRVVVHSLYWLCAAAWMSPTFLPEIGNSPPGIPLQATAVPPGLELIWWLSNTAHGADVPLIQPHWIPTVDALCETRRALMYTSFRAALWYVWLHEVAHVACGHCSSSDDKECDTKDHERNSPAPVELLVAREIEADRYALLRIFRAVRRRLDVGAIKVTDLAATSAGVALTYILFYAQRRIEAGKDSPEYPPLWFRTDDILRVEKIAASRRRGQTPIPDAKRLAEECYLLRAMLDLGHVNPLFGEWLGPTIENSRASAGDAILSKARATLRKHKLAISQRRPTRRAQCP